MASLKKILDRFYSEFDFSERLRHDPIEFPHRYTKPDDIEVAGFIASSLAYGKVDLFRPVIERILNQCGKHPASFLRDFSLKRDRRLFSGISYRFSSEDDILCFIYMISIVQQKWKSLRELFYHHFHPEDRDIRNALAGFVSSFYEIDKSAVYKKDITPQGLSHLLPLPERGSACKRMNLFLRWMVRRRDIDFGLWRDIPPSELVIPLDTHIARISGCLGLTERKTADWKTAREITDSLKNLDPEDPLRYDFALCHQGISGLCKGRNYKDICSACRISSPQK